jgi:flagellar hook-basal body complex protein FliE
MNSVGPIDEIAPEIVGALPPLAQRPGANAAAQPGVVAFGEIFGQGLAKVNETLLASQTDLQRLATGDTQNLHQIMIRLEESRLSFQLMLQIRNRLLESYQDVMKMQI